MSNLSWVAIRKGTTYCAPACGGGCTHAEYTKANRLADKLIKKCEKEVGGKWRKNIHENLGWHYSVSLIGGGGITIHEYIYPESTSYSVGFGGGTPAQVSIHHTQEKGKSIKQLVEMQIAEVQKEADRWNDWLLAVKQSLAKRKRK